MSNYVFLNNQFIKEENAFLNIKDLGFLRGYGAFDVASVKNKEVFKLKEHLERFFKSAKYLNLKIPYSKSEIIKIVDQLINKNHHSLSSIRLIISGGVSLDGRMVNKETFIILNDQVLPYSDDYYKNGVSVISREYRRTNPSVKSLDYQFAYSIYQTQPLLKAFEIIFYDQNLVLEGATSNIFIVKNGKLITSKDNILYGITRNEVIKLAKKMKIPTIEAQITLEELFSADEVFITATFKKIMPVVKIDEKTIGSGKPGKITKELMAEFNLLS